MFDLILAVQERYNTVHLATFKYMAPVYVITAFIVIITIIIITSCS